MQQTASPRNALHRILFPFLLCLGMAALAAAGLNEKARPEQLTLEDFARLQKALQEMA